ncbi:MAG: hypothetical protein K1X75_17875 [Leptospirales bacterium]|nr:hypothetical protein [Leptospirales bacterium]
MSVEPFRLQPSEDEDLDLEQEADRVSIRYVLKQNREHILDRFHRELKLAQMQADGETLVIKDFFRLPLSAGDEKWIQFQIDAINEHLAQDQSAGGEGGRSYEAQRSPRADGGGIDLVVRPRMAAPAPAPAAARASWRERLAPQLRRFGPYLLAVSAVFAPMLIPRLRNVFLRRLRIRRLGQEEPNITSAELADIFSLEPALNAAAVSAVLSAVHGLARRRQTNLIVNEAIPLEQRSSALYPCYADSHGRISMLDNAGYHLARNLERGALIFVEQKRNSTIVDEIYLDSGERLAENEDWYDFNRIAKPVLDKRPVFQAASSDYLGAAGAILAFNAALQIGQGWTPSLIALACSGATLLLVSAVQFVSRIRRRAQIRWRLMLSYMEYRAGLPGDEYVRLAADAFGAVAALEAEQVFLLQALRPGEELFVQRNDRHEIVNLFDVRGEHLHFFDGGRRFYGELQDEESIFALGPWILSAVSLAAVGVSGILLAWQAPLALQAIFGASLAALLGSVAALVIALRRRAARKAVLDYIIHRLKGDQFRGAAAAPRPPALQRGDEQQGRRGSEPAFSAADDDPS